LYSIIEITMGKLGITLAIGGSIIAFTLVIGMFALVADTLTPTVSTMSLYGHYTVRIMDPDGNLKAYIQTDNAPTHLFKHCMFDTFMGSTLNTEEAAGKSCGITSGIATFQIGDAGDGTSSDADLALLNPYADTGIADLTDQTVSLSATEATVTWDNVNDPITILQSDLETAGVGNPTGSEFDGVCVDEDVPVDGLVDCFLDEVGLFDDDGELISHATFAPTLLSKVSAGDLVDMTLTLILE